VLARPSFTDQPLLSSLQNRCDDRSTVDNGHPAISLGRRGSRLTCKDYVLETMQGSVTVLVSVVHVACLPHLLIITEACWQPVLCESSNYPLFKHIPNLWCHLLHTGTGWGGCAEALHPAQADSSSLCSDGTQQVQVLAAPLPK
jgi:hypothetical protein